MALAVLALYGGYGFICIPSPEVEPDPRLLADPDVADVFLHRSALIVGRLHRFRRRRVVVLPQSLCTLAVAKRHERLSPAGESASDSAGGTTERVAAVLVWKAAADR
jgi:hypothetical protein